MPPYSPDLNPIELAFAKLKKLLRDGAERTVDKLWDLCCRVLDEFTKAESLNYFRETGSLLLCSQTGRERVASLLPPMYIAIVERRQIVQDLIDAIGLLGGNVGRSSFRPRRDKSDDRGNGMNSVLLPSNAVLITGPSKTGDIELQPQLVFTGREPGT